MTEGLVIDIWNEPDLTFFWNRSMEQWLELWTRSFQKIRYETYEAVKSEKFANIKPDKLFPL
jgi:hypothetical protein